ncbi:MAG TPA: flagellar hook basal-body protein [Candidatus Sulfotelmatobacter sp.]|nr:flagellar hook basal-body protein [Candidatus Sulfotelmatobacter sp.]
MPIAGIVSAAQSLGFYLRLQEVTANNLANANSDGYKADRLTAHLVKDQPHAVPVETTDLAQGSLRETGRPLDLALEGSGYFVVGTAQGERLIRGGSMHLDGDSRLTDAHGNPVLGEDGPLVLNGSHVEVQRDGLIVVDGSVAGKLRLVDVEDPKSLRKEGYGKFVSTETPHPVDDGKLSIRQGAVEDANLDPVLSMVDLVAIQRAYSASADCVRSLDGVLGTITNEVGRVQ